jgi:hypothetical protein
VKAQRSDGDINQFAAQLGMVLFPFAIIKSATQTTSIHAFVWEKLDASTAIPLLKFGV